MTNGPATKEPPSDLKQTTRAPARERRREHVRHRLDRGWPERTIRIQPLGEGSASQQQVPTHRQALASREICGRKAQHAVHRHVCMLARGQRGTHGGHLTLQAADEPRAIPFAYMSSFGPANPHPASAKASLPRRARGDCNGQRGLLVVLW